MLEEKSKNIDIINWKVKLHEIIFEADTQAGRVFDIVLLIAILISIFTVILETVEEFGIPYKNSFFILELVLTILFTIEYILRVIIIKQKWKYIFSFLGIVDFLSIIPTYISFFVVGTKYLTIIRVIRLFRVFRILKLAHYLKEAQILFSALKKSFVRIFVFLILILILAVLIGSFMYVIEGGRNGFTSIPKSIYWAIVTLTTVGYGDIAPHTTLGQLFSSIVMILGYAIIAIPTGIVSVNLIKELSGVTTQVCRNCGKEGHDEDANYCKYCGYNLYE